MASAVRIRVTSALAVDLDGRALDRRALGSRKERTLLGLLAAERGQLVPLDRIVDALWPEGPPPTPEPTWRPWSAGSAACSARVR